MVVQHILDAKARGHRAYVLVDEAGVLRKAEALSEDGVPPELIHMLPHDSNIDKLQVQKAATPVEGYRLEREDAARAMAAQRPNGIVLERAATMRRTSTRDGFTPSDLSRNSWQAQAPHSCMARRVCRARRQPAV